MSDDLYERYKATLRAGHVALLRGSLDEAAESYRAAAEIAPSRALPHTSLGGVFMRLGRLGDALTEFAEAVALAPNDEGALLGQAEALTASGRRPDAAAALDRVADAQEASGRLPEAADTLRRALELEDSPERLQRHRSLLRRIRLSEGDAAAEQLLARALRLREEAPPERQRPIVSAEVAAEISRLAEPWGGPLETGADIPGDAGGSAGAVSFFDEEPVVPEALVETAAPAEAPAEIPVAEAQIQAFESAAEDSLSLDEATLEEALALRMQALGADLATADPFAIPGSVEGLPGESASLVADVAVTGPMAEPQTPGPDEEAAEIGSAPGEAPAESEGPSAEDEAAAAPVESGPEPQVPAFEAVEPALIADGESFALPEEAEPPVVAVMEQAPAAEVQRQPTGDELLAAAEAADASADAKALRSLLVWTARAYAREGRFEAALDAAHRLLQRDPADVDAHLVLVELYVARNWDALAADKLLLLDRLAQLGEDGSTHERLRAVAGRAFPGDPRFASVLS